jgi:dihydrofolate reductase
MAPGPFVAKVTDRQRPGPPRSIEEGLMTATYTFDVFSTLDGFGSYRPGSDWGGYWGKQGPEFLERRLALYREEQRMVLGASTYRQFAQLLGPGTGEPGAGDTSADPNTWVFRMPATVVSGTLEDPLDWPGGATVARGDAVDVVARLKKESEVPLRSHGSLSLNRALMAAGLVDRVQLTIFPVISGQTGTSPVFGAAADFDLELIESRILDRNTQELIYRPALHA